MNKPRSHEELDAILRERLTRVFDQLAEEHGITVVAICAIEHSDISTVIASMTPHDATVAMTAALYAYESDARIDATVASRKEPS